MIEMSRLFYFVESSLGGYDEVLWPRSSPPLLFPLSTIKALIYAKMQTQTPVPMSTSIQNIPKHGKSDRIRVSSLLIWYMHKVKGLSSLLPLNARATVPLLYWRLRSSPESLFMIVHHKQAILNASASNNSNVNKIDTTKDADNTPLALLVTYSTVWMEHTRWPDPLMNMHTLSRISHLTLIILHLKCFIHHYWTLPICWVLNIEYCILLRLQ